MSLDVATLFAESESQRYALHARYLNEQLVRVLKTVGFDVGFCRGEGQYLYDRQGTRYLDLMSGWGVFGLGRNHPAIREALKSVLDADLPNLVHMDASPLAGVLAERLLKLVPYLDKVYFCNSGTEAVETALKFARCATGRAGIAYCSHAFHGLTYGALSIIGDETFRTGFAPFLTDCVEVPFNDVAALERALATRQIAGFIVEPIQGKGVHVADVPYLKGAQELCRKYGSVFIADEIQTGLGRTGRFLAVEHSGVEPDVVLLSKSLSGGCVPIGAVLTRKWIFDKVYSSMDRSMAHGSTFGKNDLAMAAGIATLDVLKSERIIENAARTGTRLLNAFTELADRHDLIKGVRGKGLMIGIEFGPPRSSLKLRATWTALQAMNSELFCQIMIIPLLKEHKILSQVAGHGIHTIKVQPSLTITDADCEWIERAFNQVIAAAHRGPSAALSLGKTLVDNAMRARVLA
ncbi:MAG: aspartate aminotransferase family protein [Xanthobacteraceae bacterium]|jgi:ornithine--oxo-acid transaminase